jgi:hypothetical protein
MSDDWSVVSPPGWTRVSPEGAFIREALTGDVQRYSAPDSRDELALLKLETAGDKPRRVVDEILQRAVTASDGMTVEPARIFTERDMIVGRVTMSHDGEVRHVHVLAALDHHTNTVDAVIGRCTTAKVTEAPCVAALESIKLQLVPETKIDDGLPFRLIGVVFGVIVALAWIGLAIRSALRSRATKKRTPLTDGAIVTLTGVVRALDAPLIAPLSNRPCVAHRSRIHLTGLRDNSATESSRFVLETANGRVLVDGEYVFDLVPSPVVPRDEGLEKRFLAGKGVPETQHPHAGFDEIVVAPGATAVVRGVIRLEHDHDAKTERGYRDDAPVVTKLVAAPSVILTIQKLW